MSALFVGPLVGAEIEYFLVDRDALEPRDVLDALSDLPGAGTYLKPEICLQQLEIATPAFATVRELRDWFVPTHLQITARLREVGARLFPVGLLDTASLAVRDSDHMRVLADAFGPALAENAPLVAADQINLGAADEPSAMHVLEVLRRVLPELMALSVATPLRYGRPNGVASNRMAVVEATAAANPEIVGYPERLRSLADHAAAVAALPILQRPNAYYKWVRPMPQRGVAAELRCLDKQPTLGLTIAFAALCHGLARAPGSLPEDGDEPGMRRRFAEARQVGLTDPARAAALLERARGGLDPSERPLLEPLIRVVETGVTPAVALANRVGVVGLEAAYRELAAAFDADLELLASTV